VTFIANPHPLSSHSTNKSTLSWREQGTRGAEPIPTQTLPSLPAGGIAF